MTCGQRIKEERQKRHMSQEDLAERLEVSRQAVSKWEADTARPTREKRDQLSELLELPPEFWTAPAEEEAGQRRWKIIAAILAAALCLTWILGLALWPRQERTAPVEETALPDSAELFPPALSLEQRRDFDFGNWPLGEYSLDSAPLLKDPQWIRTTAAGWAISTVEMGSRPWRWSGPTPGRRAERPFIISTSSTPTPTRPETATGRSCFAWRRAWTRAASPGG